MRPTPDLLEPITVSAQPPAPLPAQFASAPVLGRGDASPVAPRAGADAPVPPQPPPAPQVQGLRALALFALLGLLVLNLGWELRWAPLRPGGSWWAIKALPLCLPLAGMLKHRLYTYRWTSLLVWLYVTEALVRAPSEHGPAAVLAWLELVLALSLFGACALYVRARLRSASSTASLPSSKSAAHASPHTPDNPSTPAGAPAAPPAP